MSDFLNKAKQLAEKYQPKRVEFDPDKVKSLTDEEKQGIVDFFLSFTPNFLDNSIGLEKLKHLLREVKK